MIGVVLYLTDVRGKKQHNLQIWHKRNEDNSGILVDFCEIGRVKIAIY
jgi:hypothetical protein